jgi:hypothetical protein
MEKTSDKARVIERSVTTGRDTLTAPGKSKPDVLQSPGRVRLKHPLQDFLEFAKVQTWELPPKPGPSANILERRW